MSAPSAEEFGAILIAGPTASGKSGLALTLAERLAAAGREALILNADAMQVYRDLRVLTARPSPEDEARAPHALYGYLDAAARCSAGVWARAAAVEAEAALARGAVLIIVGGTGLYFRALTEGLSPMPEVSAEIMTAAAARREALGPEDFRADVLARDPAMARFPASDAQRMQRAWSVHEATGTPLSDWQAAPPEPLLSRIAARLVLEPPRDALYANCEKRFDAMLEAGAVEEVERLIARGLDPSLPAMKALGVPEIAAALTGAMTLAAAADEAKTRTRQFAKRQLTWFRNQTADWERAGGVEDGLQALSR